MMGLWLISGLATAEGLNQAISMDQHLGVASCASSVCHGSVQPFPDSRIQQNEFITWQTDRHGNMHAKAYTKLQTAQAMDIAAKLSLGKPWEAQECLSCHTDWVPPAQRGEQFQLADGVSCEACHGGAGRYLDTHTNKAASLSEKQQAGLYPTWQPQARAKLCLGCHMGDERHNINHRIMGAGHPRLQFELDTFTYLQPHHLVDQDYIQRKGDQNNARDWAIGQALAADHLLTMLQDSEQGWRGIFIEPLLLDCHSCHQRMDGERWQQRSGTGLGPGEMRLNDANLVMVRLIMTSISPDMAATLKQQTLKLHRATTQGRRQLLQMADELQKTLQAVPGLLVKHQFTADHISKVLTQLKIEADNGELSDYAAAEQSAMAVINMLSVLEQSRNLDSQRLQQQIDQLFAAVADEYAYRPQLLAQALQGLRRLITTAE